MASLRAAVALTLATLSFSASLAQANESRLILDYELRYGLLRLVAVRTAIDLARDRYSARAEMRTVGAVGFVFPWTSLARSRGVRTAGGLMPEQHRAEGVYRGEARRIEIDYSGGAVRAHAEPPPEGDWRDAVPPAMQIGTVDPLTASLSAIEANCAGAVPVFDGRRRYNLNLSDLGLADVESSYNLYSGPARHCRAVVEALGGFWVTDPRQSETPTTLDYWLASPRPGMPPVPVYLELTSARGTLRIDLIAAAPERSGS